MSETSGFHLPLQDVDEVDEPVLPVAPPTLPTAPSSPAFLPMTPLPEDALPEDALPEDALPVAPLPAPPLPVGLLATASSTQVSPPPPPAASVAPSLVVAPVAPPQAADQGITRLADADLGAGDRDLVLDDVLLILMERGGSDLHLTVGSPPRIRVHGDLESLNEFPVLTPYQVQQAMYSVLTDRQKQAFEENKELDFAYELPGAARFRVNLMYQHGAMAAVLRLIPWEIQPLDSLGMPPELGDMANLPRGLVLVTGPTGSGKSTTLAAVIDRANRTRKAHIVTIEDPIEFVHRHRLSLVNQREVGEDTPTFASALKHVLRQDPDIILVGEMRDLETIAIALTAAETGHLVFGTLHTSSAGSTIDRIVDVFPPAQQSQIRTQLAASIQAIVCQTLCRRVDGAGRVAATEVLVATPAIRNLIREGKLQSIPSALQTGSRFGMHTLNQDLARLVTEGAITYEVALEKCSDAAELNQLLGRTTDDAAD